MAVNDFLTVANDPGAHVESQLDYAASVYRGLGYPDGYSPPADEFNKMLRQSSAMAALLAAWLVAQTGQDMLDDGDTDAKVTIFQLGVRRKLLADTTFYLATTGNDNTGDGSVGAPWKTIQHAWDVLQASYDLNGFTATVQLANGNYTDTAILSGWLVGQGGPENFVINGNNANVASVSLSTNAPSSPMITAVNDAYITVQNLTMTASYKCLYANRNGSISFQNIAFGVSGQHINATDRGHIHAIGDYSITGNVGVHMSTDTLAEIEVEGRTVTITGNPAWGTSFCSASVNSVIFAISMTFVGAATGKRYSGESNSVINSGAGGANYFPGNSAGSVASGALYI